MQGILLLLDTRFWPSTMVSDVSIYKMERWTQKVIEEWTSGTFCPSTVKMLDTLYAIFRCMLNISPINWGLYWVAKTHVSRRHEEWCKKQPGLFPPCESLSYIYPWDFHTNHFRKMQTLKILRQQNIENSCVHATISLDHPQLYWQVNQSQSAIFAFPI